MSGRSSPICVCCSDTCLRSPARNCCSWATNSGRCASGRTTPAWNGTYCSILPSRRAILGGAIESGLSGEPALHELDTDPAGFEWVDCNDNRDQRDFLSAQREIPGTTRYLIVCNFTPVPRVGLPGGSPLRRILAGTAEQRCPGICRQRHGERGGVRAEYRPGHGRPHSLRMTLPPLGVLFLKPA